MRPRVAGRGIGRLALFRQRFDPRSARRPSGPTWAAPWSSSAPTTAPSCWWCSPTRPGWSAPARLPRRADLARPPRPASVDRHGPVAAAGGALQARPAADPGHRVKAGATGRPACWRAASAARCRTAWGLRVGMPSPWRMKDLRSDGQVVPSSAAAALTLPSRSASAKARSASARSARKRLAASPPAAGHARPTGRRRRGLDQHSAVG
jgi:hypothetical protein